MEDDDMDGSLDGAMSRRACDSCRTRKIRCDRGVPCSNCKASKLACKTTPPQQKAQRQRVHISEEYEKKIDRIEDRLAGIENALASLATKLGSLDLQKDTPDTSCQSRSSRIGPSRSPGSHLVESHTPAPFEGESSINSQSDYARVMLAQAIGSTPSIGQNEEVKMAFTALAEMVSQQGQNNTHSNHTINHSLADIDPANLERPPWDIACYALEKATEYPTMAFAVLFPFLRMANLKDIFHEAYHNPETCSAARRVLTFGVLENVFNEFRVFPLVNMDTTKYYTYATICRRQTEVALSQLPICLPATFENIMALLLGAAQAVEKCRPSLCWTMVSSAAALCQSLGYHRINTMVNDNPKDRQTKIHIFWMIYMLDKTLSLRLGRSSILQDWDISLPFVVSSDTNDQNPESSDMLSYWIKVARVQGLTYEKLFCPAAFLKSTEERTRIAIELVNTLNQIWYERGDASRMDFNQQGSTFTLASKRPSVIGHAPNETPLPSQYKRYVHKSPHMGRDPGISEYIQGSFERIQDIFFYSDVVMHYSTVALIQRAVSPSNMSFNQECLKSSRAALVAHMRASAQFNIKGQEDLWSGYVHWSILQAPFTPFIVLFCNAIQKADSSDVDSDLNSLSEFVTSLESCRTISEGADKLYKMCHLFLRVTKLYVAAKRQDAASRLRGIPQNEHSGYYTTVDGTQLDLSTMSQFDPYLTALGLLPETIWPTTTYSTAPTPANINPFGEAQAIHNANDGEEPGFGAPQENQNHMQEWFSGSRYLLNMMEPGDDLHRQVDLQYVRKLLADLYFASELDRATTNAKMATPTPTQNMPIPPEERLALEQQARYQRITRNLAIGGLVLCPIIAAMPPRKLDLYTFSLGIGFYLSADHLITLRTGRGLVQNLSPMRTMELPTERAKEMQKILQEEREKSRKTLERKEGQEKSILGKLWMGDEEEGWKERRLEEEKKAIEEGKSYGDMIFEQIWEVWNWDKKGKGDGGKKE